uniref:Uncharacterized protein n=1 Tax=Rhizophora mucronata TaxID=61149 RepID=A0A2P2MPU0_RHIMU
MPVEELGVFLVSAFSSLLSHQVPATSLQTDFLCFGKMIEKCRINTGMYHIIYSLEDEII